MARRTSGAPEEPRLVSRKHISRAQRDAQRRRQIILGTIVLGALVALILAGGAVYSAFFEPNRAVAVVDGEEISRRDYQKRVNYERFRLFQTAEENRTQAEELLTDPQSAQFIAQFFGQQLGQLQQIYLGIGTQSLEGLIEERLIAREAEARGITVTDAEVDEEVRRQMARLEGAQIEADVTATGVAAQEATATAELWTPTPTLEPSATPTISGTVEANADITETEPLTPTATPAATSTPLPTATPNILSDDTFATTYADFLSQMQNRAGFTEAEFRNVLRYELLREKLQEAYEAEVEVETTEEQVHVAHILVETEEAAQGAVERLNAGEAFEDLAAELSSDTANAQQGGELEWFGRNDSLDPAFIEASFALTEPDQVSAPVQSQFGWHLIRLLEGPTQRAQAFSDWLSEQRSSETVQRFWTEDDVPDDPFGDEIFRPLPTPLPVPTTALILTPQGTDGGAEATPEADDATEDEAGDEAESTPASADE